MYYDVDLDSPDVHYLSTITVRQGKVYAMFIKSPPRLFAAEEARLRGMLASFRTIN